MIDLHIHSRYSEDGEFTPTELVEQCAKAGIDTMAIADHNCVRAIPEARKAAETLHITYIPAIEIDCIFQDINFHVLGYGIEDTAEDFAMIDKNIDDQSFQASMKRLHKTQELGFHVTEDDMRKAEEGMFWTGRWTGELFAEVLLEKEEYENHPLLKPYRPGGSRSDNPYVNFYWDFYSQGKPCYAEILYPSMQEIIDIIHRNGGKAVLAHPGVNLKGKEAMFSAIAALGIDGAEVFSSYHTDVQTDHFYEQAKQHGLYLTAGSDYHGKSKPSISLGSYSATESHSFHEHVNPVSLIEWLNL